MRPLSSEQQRLAQDNMDEVRIIAKGISKQLPAEVDLRDLLNAGSLGLCEAAARFQPNNGTDFVVYARNRIRGEILDFLRTLDTRGRGQLQSGRKIDRIVQRAAGREGKGLNRNEIAREMAMGPEAFDRLYSTVVPPVYVDPDDIDIRAGRPSPEDEASKKQLLALIGEHINELSDERHKTILVLYFLEGLFIKEIAEKHLGGLTESRGCQLLAEAVLALRKLCTKHDAELAGYVELNLRPGSINAQTRRGGEAVRAELLQKLFDAVDDAADSQELKLKLDLFIRRLEPDEQEAMKFVFRETSVEALKDALNCPQSRIFAVAMVATAKLYGMYRKSLASDQTEDANMISARIGGEVMAKIQPRRALQEIVSPPR